MLRKNNVLQRMRKICCVAFLLLVLAGCRSKTPGDIIQPEKMAAILYDIHVTDGYIGSIPKQDSAKKVSAAYYKGIYAKFGIDSVKYTKSMSYYFANPDVLSGIYVKVTDALKKSKDSLEKINENAVKLEAAKRAKAVKKTKDSLDKIRAKLSPLEIKKLKADSLRKVKTDSLKVVKAVKKTKDSLAKISVKTGNLLNSKPSQTNSSARARKSKKLIDAKKSIADQKLKSGKAAVEVN